mmetsp:Transcript_24800/g.81742  ORF Transcript_24800/g.81742 Transcript_24800/m.81742 type:complete len:247 (+) Transcript_24800:801-1541(+)
MPAAGRCSAGGGRGGLPRNFWEPSQGGEAGGSEGRGECRPASGAAPLSRSVRVGVAFRHAALRAVRHLPAQLHLPRAGERHVGALVLGAAPRGREAPLLRPPHARAPRHRLHLLRPARVRRPQLWRLAAVAAVAAARRPAGVAAGEHRGVWREGCGGQPDGLHLPAHRRGGLRREVRPPRLPPLQWHGGLVLCRRRGRVHHRPRLLRHAAERLSAKAGRVLPAPQPDGPVDAGQRHAASPRRPPRR